ncbi:MAG: glutamate racemase [Evtepia gabavorous]
MEAQARPIGVFDSGLGGISVLRACVRLLPQENFLFFGDSANAPYGEKSLDQVRALTLSAVDRLLEQGVKGIVVACNTATSAAIGLLRQLHPGLPIIGIEPAVKPAALAAGSSSVIVMATPSPSGRINTKSWPPLSAATPTSSPCPARGWRRWWSGASLTVRFWTPTCRTSSCLSGTATSTILFWAVPTIPSSERPSPAISAVPSPSSTAVRAPPGSFAASWRPRLF